MTDVLRPLGRHVHHDPRSLAFPAKVASARRTVLHKRHSHIWDQGDVGSCTGNAMAGVLGTDPFWQGRRRRPNEKLAVELYRLATTFDDIDGTYQPDDTGSSGLAVAKATQSLGLIGRYEHAFGLDHCLDALSLAPVIIGIPWYSSFDDAIYGHLMISPGAYVRGGHELELHGLDVDGEVVRGANSWGRKWGDRGFFTMHFDTLGRLLDEQGDVTTFA